jgi:hypothetical protein
MANSARQPAAAQPRDPTELRLLVELPALRKLADRGLSDEELAMTRQLAEATWWASRAPAEGDAVIADLMVKHAIALVDRERLLAAVAQAEERAANLALETISGRLISMATGIVMRQRGLSPDDAEDPRPPEAAFPRWR